MAPSDGTAGKINRRIRRRDGGLARTNDPIQGQQMPARLKHPLCLLPQGGRRHQRPGRHHIRARRRHLANVGAQDGDVGQAQLTLRQAQKARLADTALHQRHPNLGQRHRQRNAGQASSGAKVRHPQGLTIAVTSSVAQHVRRNQAIDYVPVCEAR